MCMVFLGRDSILNQGSLKFTRNEDSNVIVNNNSSPLEGIDPILRNGFSMQSGKITLRKRHELGNVTFVLGVRDAFQENQIEIIIGILSYSVTQ
jgi:hypothetical protein